MSARQVALTLALLLMGCAGDDDADGRAAPVPPTTVAPEEVVSAYESLALPYAAPACVEATMSSDPAQLVAAFNAARLAGKGAEACLAEEASAAYTDGDCDDTSLESAPGPTALYACGERRVVAIPDESVEAVKTDHRSVQQEVFFEGLGRRGQPEHLTIGPGTPVGGTAPARQVITGVSPI